MPIAKQYERVHKDKTYYITVDEGVLINEDKSFTTVYFGYVSIDKKPTPLIYGELVKDHNNKPMLFSNILSAQTNINAVIDSY